MTSLFTLWLVIGHFTGSVGFECAITSKLDTWSRLRVEASLMSNPVDIITTTLVTSPAGIRINSNGCFAIRARVMSWTSGHIEVREIYESRR